MPPAPGNLSTGAQACSLCSFVRPTWGRSQVAEAYFERLSRHEVCSSGLRVDESMARNKPPSNKLKDNSRHSLPYMLERGIDISEKERTQITPELVASADRIVAILPTEEVPAFLTESGEAGRVGPARPCGPSKRRVGHLRRDR